MGHAHRSDSLDRVDRHLSDFLLTQIGVAQRPAGQSVPSLVVTPSTSVAFSGPWGSSPFFLDRSKKIHFFWETAVWSRTVGESAVSHFGRRAWFQKKMDFFAPIPPAFFSFQRLFELLNLIRIRC